jgi:hypothetical protein
VAAEIHGRPSSASREPPLHQPPPCFHGVALSCAQRVPCESHTRTTREHSANAESLDALLVPRTAQREAGLTGGTSGLQTVQAAAGSLFSAQRDYGSRLSVKL